MKEEVNKIRKHTFIKRAVATILAMCMMVGMGTTVFAEATSVVENSESTEMAIWDFTILNNSDDVLYFDFISDNERSTSVPTQFHDLSNSSYFADLELVKTRWLYTNRYFRGNSDGKMHVSYYVQSDGIPGTMKIGLYSFDTKSIVTSWTATPVDGVASDSFYFTNLKAGTNYAVAFTASPEFGGAYPEFTGNATISH